MIAVRRRAVELALELVEERGAIAVRLVADRVHEPRESVDRLQVRSRLARGEERDDREVLRAGARVDSLEREPRRVRRDRNPAWPDSPMRVATRR